MELRHLRYFVAVAEAENVSKAALKLHVSQPGLSRQVHDLEDELGFTLFERSAKSVRLTQAGKAFLTEARAVLQRAEQAVSTARAVATGAHRELHVGYAPTPTARVLPAALRAFQEQFPKVRVKLHDLSTEEMLAGLREGKLEIALMFRPGRAILRGFHFEELARDKLCLAVPHSHAMARMRSVPLLRVGSEPLVVFSRADYPEYHELLDSLFAPIKVRPRVVEEHDSAASLIAAIESGSGLAIVPESFSCFSGTRLKLIALSPSPEPLIIGSVWPRKKLSPDAEMFRKSAKEAVSGMKPIDDVHSVA